MTKPTTEIDLNADLIDIREIIDAYEGLETELHDAYDAEDEANEESGFLAWVKLAGENDDHTLQEAATQFLALHDALDETRGNGGDEQWRGDSYPVTLIHERYFETYARELAEDIGAISNDASWPNNHIDWTAAAEALQQDYTSVEIAGETYYTR